MINWLKAQAKYSRWGKGSLKPLVKWLIKNGKSPDLGWYILHHLKNDGILISPWQITHTEIQSSNRRPAFGFNPGYFEYEGKNLSKDSAQLLIAIKDTAKALNYNSEALSNLYILLQRVSAKNEDRLTDQFLDFVGTEKIKELLECFAVHVNQIYKNLDIYQQELQTSDDWGRVFTSSQYLDGIFDPVSSFHSISIKLTNDWQKCELGWVVKLDPLVRGRLLDFFGVQIEATSSDVVKLIRSTKYEASFISAYLIELSPNQSSPEWLNKEIVEILFLDNWINAGHFLLRYAYGISPRAQNEELSNNLKVIFSKILSEHLKNGNEEFQSAFFASFKWPHDFISIINWIREANIQTELIGPMLHEKLAETIFNVWNNLISEAPVLLGSKTSLSGVDFYTLSDPKYINIFPHLLHFIISSPVQTENIGKSFFDIKQLYYGTWNAQHLAEEYTELMLITILTGSYLKLDNDQRKNYNSLIDAFIARLWFPYILRAENSEYIWNPDYKHDVQFHNYTKYIINELLFRMVQVCDYSIESNKIIGAFKSYKTASWPFERHLTI